MVKKFMKKRPYKATEDSAVFDVINTIVMIIVSLFAFLPFWYIVCISFSEAIPIMQNIVTFWPVGFTLNSYKAVLQDATMITSFGFTITLVLMYTAIAMCMTIMAAYPLSKRSFPGKHFFLIVILITMYFNAGVIPNYMLVRDLGLINSIWALILPGMVSAYNLIVLRTFFRSISPTLTEAAYLDGCSEFTILVRIILPLSLPVLATLSLFYAVGRWNGFSDALYYITDSSLYPLQLKLREIIMSDSVSTSASLDPNSVTQQVVQEGVKAASIVFATLPILCVYPFLQKYFITGIMIGSVKE